MKNSDKPAMPTGKTQTGTGLSKREYIAAMALQGLLSNEFVSDFVGKTPGSGDQMGKIYAKMAIDFADELLEEL